MSSSSYPSMRIILFSVLSSGAIRPLVERLTELSQQVLLLVTTSGTNKRAISHYPEIVAGVQRGLDVLVTTHLQRLPELLNGLSPDLILVAGFPRKIPSPLLALPRLGCINWHPSLLPQYRGPEPLYWQIMNGETRTGVTFHRMDDHFDTGPVLAQRSVDIEPEIDMRSLLSTLLDLTYAMLPDVLQAVAAGVPGTPQPVQEATYAPHVAETDYFLNWSRPAMYLERQVRIWSMGGGIRATLEGRDLFIRRVHVINSRFHTSGAKPGSILRHTPDGILVQAGQDALLLEEYSFEAE